MYLPITIYGLDDQDRPFSGCEGACERPQDTQRVLAFEYAHHVEAEEEHEPLGKPVDLTVEGYWDLRYDDRIREGEGRFVGDGCDGVGGELADTPDFIDVFERVRELFGELFQLPCP